VVLAVPDPDACIPEKPKTARFFSSAKSSKSQKSSCNNLRKKRTTFFLPSSAITHRSHHLTSRLPTHQISPTMLVETSTSSHIFMKRFFRLAEIEISFQFKALISKIEQQFCIFVV
jgi:hypothetical protein